MSLLSRNDTHPDDRPTAASKPRHHRWRTRVSPALVLLLAVCGLAAVSLARVGLHNFLWQPDESLFVQLGRYVEGHFPGSVVEYGVYQRGPQRLTVLLLAVMQWVFDAPTGLQVARIVQAVLFVSVAIPAYVLGRSVGLSRTQAVLPAGLSVVIPWSVVGTTFLTENLAYPIAAWAMLTFWRTAVQPSRGADALALSALCAGVLAKTSLTVLAPVLATMVLVQIVRYPASQSSMRLRDMANTLWTQHAILVIGAAVVAAIAGITTTRETSISSSLFGVYGTPAGVSFHSLAHQSQVLLSRLVMGMAFLPICVALPWLARSVTRPTSSSDHALGVLTVASTCTFVLTTALIWGDDRPGVDERYVMYVAVPIFVVAMRAVCDKSISVVGIGIASVVVAAVVGRTAWGIDQGSGVKHLTYPVEAFFGQVVLGRIALYEPAGLAGHEGILVGLAAGVGSTALVGMGRLAARYGRGTMVVGIAVAGVITFQVTQTAYTLDRWYTDQGVAPPSWSARAWVDAHNRTGRPVAIFGIGFGNATDYAGIWDEIRFFNTTIGPVIKLGPGKTPEPAGAEVTLIDVRRSDGRLITPRPLPQLAVTTHDALTVGLPLPHVRDAPYLDAQLVRLPRELQAEWIMLGGVYEDAFIEPPGPATLRVFTAGLPAGRKACLRLTLEGPQGYTLPWEYRVTGGRQTLIGRVRAQEMRPLVVGLVRTNAEGHFRDVRITAPNSVPYPDARNVGLRIVRIVRAVC
jgi:hypothetical protein